MNDIMTRKFLRFIAVQQRAVALATTVVDHPPMQAPASQARKARAEGMIKGREGQQRLAGTSGALYSVR